MELSRGPVYGPQLIVAYGPEGVGKTTFASCFPNPVFVDIEGSTTEFDVTRTPRPQSYVELQGIISELTKNPQDARTIVVDTVDWAENLIKQHICAENGLSTIGGNDDFGRSYNLLDQEFRAFLDSLSLLRSKTGCHVVLLAHCDLRKFELPEEAGAYDRWELKLEKKTRAAAKEWPGMLLFLKQKIMVVEVDRKIKANDLGRVIETCQSAVWDAKNRHNLPQEIDLPLGALPAELSAIINREDPAAQKVQQRLENIEQQASVQQGQPDQERQVEQGQVAPSEERQEASEPSTPGASPPPKKPALPQALASLMERDGITEAQVRWAVGQKGYYPEETPITTYDAKFIANLVAVWDKVVELIKGANL